MPLPPVCAHGGSDDILAGLRAADGAARRTPELERVQAELGARTSFREAARILDTLLPASPANQESVRTRTHAVALRIEADDRQAAAEVTAVHDGPNKAATADEHRPIVMLDGAYMAQ